MARNYTSTSTVNLQVNAKQASQMLKTLEQDTQRLEKQFKKAEAAGDKVTMKNLRKQIMENEKLMRTFKTEASQAADVMRRLDRATPKELNATLRQLQSQLKNISRGTAEWNKQVAAIKRVKSEIDKMNVSMAASKTGWQKLNGWLNNTQTAIMGIVAAVSGLVAAGRQAVNRYAEMDEAIANSVKYTRMSRSEVEQLNEAFKKMDTRLYRDELNLLAQEAGRLGYNTIESVKGYTEAAQIINVALVDLGEGATQSIAKLTNIFGVEQAMGIKKAMLSVGSAVNILSQNCTASKPYLVNFAQRMAGIGAQAGMTIPQILALGAVLDANGQKVEMSATAIQKVMMNLANKNQEFAKTLGLDAKELNRTLKYSAIDGLMMFLQKIHDIGESTSYENATMALAPAFKEMGLDAARVAQVLSTLAGHIDEIKWQLGEADTAFREASSATNEFNIFNNTAQASIDKAKGRVRELAIELGEKLYPIMKHIYTSSGVFLRVLNAIVSFIVENKTLITSLVTAMIGYGLAVSAATIKTWALTAAHYAHATAVSIEKAAITLLSAGYYMASGNMAKASAAMRLFNMTLAANPIGVVVAALSALIPLIVKLCSHTDTYIDKANKVIEKGKEISETTIKEQRELGILVGKLKGAEAESEEYKKVKDQLISQYGRYLSGLIDEKGEIIDLTEAYNVLAQAIQRTNALRNIQTAKDEIEQKYDKDQADNLTKLQKSLENYGADPVVIGEIIMKVSSAIGAGEDIPVDVRNQIRTISRTGSPKYDDKGTELNSVNRWIASNTNLPGVRHVTKPEDVLFSIMKDSKDFKQATKSLDSVEMGMNPTKNLSNDILLKTYKDLSKLVEGNASDFISVPNFFIPDEIPDAYFAHAYIKDDEQRHKLAAKSRSGSAGRYVQTASKNGEKANPLTSVDPTENKFSVDPLGKVKRDKYNGETTIIAVSPLEADKMREEVAKELRLRGVTFGTKKEENKSGSGNNSFSSSNHSGGSGNSNDNSEDKFSKENKWREYRILNAEMKRAKGFYVKNPTEDDKAKGIIDPYRKPYTIYSYESELINIDKKYYEKLLKRDDLTKQERLTFEKEQAENNKKLYDFEGKTSEEAERIRHEKKISDIRGEWMDGVYNREQYDQAIKDEELMHAAKLVVTFQRLAKEAMLKPEGEYDGLEYDEYKRKADDYEKKLYDLEFKDFEDKQNKFDQKVGEYKKKFEKLSPEELYQKFYDEIWNLKEEGNLDPNIVVGWAKGYLNDAIKDIKPVNGEKQKISEAQKKYNEQTDLIKGAWPIIAGDEEISILTRLKNEYNESLITPLKNAKSEWVSLIATMTDSWMDFADALKDPDASPFEALSSGIAATAAVMSAVMSQVTEFTKAQTEIQTKAVEKRYDRELAFAEGNSYLTKKLEKKKQQEIAKIKEDAANKEFAMQVIMAIAQTATNALNAYGSAAAIPVVGHILAPIAAATAVAAGLVQVAAIKKQKEAAAASGYSKGGFTKPGAVDEPAGVVHAGEWVASQSLVNSPRTRPIIDMLEYAQRTNRIGSLSMEDVSRSISAPLRLASRDDQTVQIVSPYVNESQGNDSDNISSLSKSIARLNERLDEPFITRNCVSGDLGYKQAEDKYKRMMRNKSRRSRS